MKKIHLAIFKILAISCFIITTVNAQTTKNTTKKFTLNEATEIHVNTTHTNVTVETWDKNEIEITFKLEADEKVEELFEKWDYDAIKDGNTITIESQSSHYFDMGDFNFDFNFDMSDFNFDMQDMNLDMSDFNIEINEMVTDIMDDLDLGSMPKSPFGDNVSFDKDDYEKNPDAYLEKLNKKYKTNVTKRQTDNWLNDLEEWADDIEIKMENKEYDFSEMEKEIEEKTKGLEESVAKWEKENGEKIKEMTEKIQLQMKDMDFEKFENFNYFDQENSKIKKSIHIKLPKKSKLRLNVRYGEVNLAENVQNINADLNYASLSAKTIKGASTDISASFAPINVNHWKAGDLTLNHCKDITIKLVDQINLNAEGTDIIIGTLLNSGYIHSTYGDLEIQNLGADLKNLKLIIDYGDAKLNIPSNALDLAYKANQHSLLSLPKEYKVISDATEGNYRVLKAYNLKQNSGKLLSVLANYGDLIIK